MKNYTQVYVKNSMEAAKTYCKTATEPPMNIVNYQLMAKAFWQ